MKTPCVAACKNEAGICSGCHRTVEEITTWRYMTDSKRDEIMATLSGGSATHNCPQCGSHATCDISQGKSSCWCFELDQRDTSQLASHDSCLCRKCLTKLPVA